MRSFLVASTFALASAAFAQAPQAQPQIWTVTCSEGGRTVYLERIAGAPSQAKEQQVNARYPSAVCAYLAPEASSNELPGIGAVIGNLQGPPGTPGDIGAALRVIRGEKIGVTPAVPQPPVASPVMSLSPTVGVGVIIDEPASAPVPAETKPGRVRLATYGTLNNEDVLADWHRRIEVQPLLRGYAPVLTHFDGRTLLSIDRVGADERIPLCFLAASVGFACSGGEAADGRAAIESLSMSYPAHFFVPEPAAASSRVPEIGQGACGEASVGQGMECMPWPLRGQRVVNLLESVKAPTAAKPAAAKPQAKEARPQRRPGIANSSSTSTPRSRSAMAIDTATNARSASALIR